jgi:TonB family protein
MTMISNFPEIKFLLVFLIPIMTVFRGEAQNQADSRYSIVTQKNDSLYTLEEFNSDSVLLFTGELRSREPEIRHGLFRFYYGNKKLEAVGVYYDGIPYGKWVFYNENGKVKQVIDYKSVIDFMFASHQRKDMAQGMDKNNKQPGAGSGQPVNVPVPEAFREYLSENLFYPPYARDMGISGKVVVKFTVDKHGKVNSADILEGDNTDLNMEALRVIISSTGWEPVISEKGDTLSVSMTVPVSFGEKNMK